MCQRSDQGGRCFPHSKGTQANLSYIHAKTGVDKKEIYAILKELKQEGRELPAPDTATVEQYFDLEEFKTKFDNTIPEKERIAILKNILTARAEAREHGVKGGVMHAWKNGLKRTLQKAKRPLIAIGVVGALSVSLAGCAGAIKEAPETPQPTSTSQEINTKLEGLNIGETVTDEYGEYQKVTLAEDSPLNTLNPALFDSTVSESGFNNDELLEAQKLSAKFLTEEGIDSIAIDTGRWDEWANTKGQEYIDSNLSSQLLGNNNEGRPSTLINNNSLNANPLFVRDGKPRMASSKSELVGVIGGQHQAVGGYVEYHYDNVTQYRVTDEAAVSHIKLKFPEMSQAEFDQRIEPALIDGKNENLWNVSSTVSYAVAKDKAGSWKIVGYSNNFSSSPVHWFQGE